MKGRDKLAQDNEIMFDFVYFKPVGIHSYRGYYHQLAIGYTVDSDYQPKVGDILKLCKDAVGKCFTGYKGGDFLMTEKTPLWVSNFSEVGDTAIVDVIDAGWKSVIETRFLDR